MALSLAFLSAAASSVYTNHMVGGSSGWFFDEATNGPSTNYSSRAANLGDFLLFNSDSNQTVIQTYNLTTYQSCSTEDDTFQYDGRVAAFGQAMTILVSLTVEGTNYFFSDADDGVQCQDGMSFEITVNHGSGLPPPPPPPPYMETPGTSTGTRLSPSSVSTACPSGNGGVAVTLIGFVSIWTG